MKYFLFGFVLDVLTASYTLRVVNRKAVLAATLSGMITFINITVYGALITQGLPLGSCILFAFGCACGTGLVTGGKR